MTTKVTETYNSSNTSVVLEIEKGFISINATIDITTQAGKDAYNDFIEDHCGGRPDDRK